MNAAKKIFSEYVWISDFQTSIITRPQTKPEGGA